MSNNEKNEEMKEDEVIQNIKRFRELYDAETFLNEKILKTQINKKESFVLFNKEWLTKWKTIVCYEELKEKLKNVKIEKEISKEKIDEVSSLFNKNNTKKKLAELGKMDSSNLKRKIGNKIFINEKSNFIPIISHKCAYFSRDIDKPITVNSEISNGIIYIHDLFPEKNKEQKLILLYKNSENDQEFTKPIITLEPNVKIQSVVNELKKKKIDEIINKSDYKIEIIKPGENDEKELKEKERKEKEEKERREKEEKERKEKEKEEKERKEKQEKELKEKAEKERKEKAEKERKEKEEKERKEKEEKERKEKVEKERKEKEEKERREKEEKERKEKEEREKAEKERKEKEEREKRIEEEKKKKEKEDKEKLQKEIERRKKEQEEDIKKEIEQKNKANKERERNVNKQYNNNLQNILCDAVKKQISFEEKIRQNGNKKAENFKLECKIIQKKYFNNFEKIFNPIKEEIKKSPNDAEQIFQDAINNSTIKFNELENLVPKKPEELIPQALVNIEELAFVDDEFAAKIMSLNVNQNINNQNNQINNNQVSPMPQIPKANIIIHNGAGVIQPQGNNNVFIMNFKNDNINKPENIQLLDFKNAKDNMFEKIPIKSDQGLIELVKKEYIDINMPKKPEKPKTPVMPKPIKPRITLDGRDCSLGLDNVGATCYMNATLQCLAHLKRITEHIINYREDGKVKDEKKYRLCEAYSEVVCSIWLPKDKTKKSFAPDRFKRILGDMNSLFAPTAANDAKDLLIYFIEQMHSELNVTSETNLNLIMPDDMNPMDHQQVLKCFVEEFMKKYNSVFSHYCYGSNVSVTNCNGCGVQKFSYQCFSFIIFPLLEAKKNCVLEGRLNPMFYNSYILNIEDCFKYNQKIELFNGNNQMYCNICQGSRDSWMQTRISSPPLVLILILNRGRGNLDFREPFTFWETIDLTGYLEFPLPDNKYFLSGVVSHMGDSGPSGHFIAFCRMSESQKWYCYNDSLVTESSFQDINSRGFPYILFYQKSQM